MSLPTVKSAVIAATSLFSPALAQVPSALYGTFYPPSLNSTSWISNTTGTYAAIYQAHTYDSFTNATYGTYDFCSMPHPRAQEYKLPAPVANGSCTAELVYIQRHQRRTTYNILPGGEDVAYNCENIEPFLYAGPGEESPSQQQPMRVYAATYTDPANPFDDTYVEGTCQYPQLTIGGLLDGFQHGNDLWSVYGKKLSFLPKYGPDSSTWFRSSSSPLTQQSAGGVLRGIWPNYHRPVPLHQQTSSLDTVNAGFSCDLRSTVLSTIESTAEWDAHLTATAPLLSALSGYTQNDSDWTSTFDHLGDNFQARLCNGYNLPCPAGSSEGSGCVTKVQADEVFRAGDWEWNYYWWRNNPNATVYIQTVEGLFIQDILDQFARVQSGTTKVKYVHDFVHDGDVGPIAGALGIEALRWPGMGSNIVFELWKVKDGGIYARVLYNGQPIETIHGRLDWLPLDSLISILKPFVPTDVVALCNS